MRFYSLIIMLALVISACSGAKHSIIAIKENQQADPGDTLLYAVIPYTDKTWSVNNGGKPADLSDSEIKEIDSLLSVAIVAHNKSHINDAPQLIDARFKYKRQLVPSIDRNGKKIVWVNCLCSPWGNWRKEIVLVADGGSCYFNLTIDLTTKTYSAIMVNGQG